MARGRVNLGLVLALATSVTIAAQSTIALPAESAPRPKDFGFPAEQEPEDVPIDEAGADGPEIEAVGAALGVDGPTAQQFRELAMVQPGLSGALRIVGGFTAVRPELLDDGTPVLMIYGTAASMPELKAAAKDSLGHQVAGQSLGYRETQYSRSQLSEYFDQVAAVVTEEYGPSDSLVHRSLFDGTVTVVVTGAANARLAPSELLTAASGIERMPDGVSLIIEVVATLYEGNEAAVGVGGEPAGSCTGGFGVSSPMLGGSRTGMLTAGHCNNNARTANGVTFDPPDVPEMEEDNPLQGYDSQVNGAPTGDSVTNGQRIASNIVDWGTPDDGTFVCLDGKTTSTSTGFSFCASVDSWDSTNRFSFTASDSNCSGGDSGGPYTLAGVAYGIHKGKPDGTRCTGVRLDMNTIRNESIVTDGNAGTDYLDAWTFRAVNPKRVYDSRSGAKIAANSTKTIDLSSGTYNTGAMRGALIAVAVVDPAAPGFLRFSPDSTMPAGSSLNFVNQYVVSNTVFVKTDQYGKVRLRSSQSTHVVIDFLGFSADGSGASTSTGWEYRPSAHTRIYDAAIPANGSDDLEVEAPYTNVPRQHWLCSSTRSSSLRRHRDI